EGRRRGKRSGSGVRREPTRERRASPSFFSAAAAAANIAGQAAAARRHLPLPLSQADPPLLVDLIDHGI
ncbi:hypothetical protein MUK42_18112, partial [Musa troglodytarum]